MPVAKTFKKMRKKLFKPKAKIYFSISSEGLGHSSRAIAISRQFKPEEIIVGSYNYAYDKLVNLEIPAVKVTQELELVGEQGVFNVGKTIMKNHSWALNFNKMVQEEIEIIQKHRASCVVADGRLVPVMAAEKLGLPCIIITNQSAFYPFFAKDSALIKVFGRSFDWIMKTWLSSTEEIMIPDFPPPYTICLPNLSQNFKVMKRTRFVGPLVYWNRKEITGIGKPDSSKPYVIVTLGGHSYRKPILDYMFEVAQKMPHINFDVFASFSSDVKIIPNNLRVLGMVNNIAEYMKSADIVVTQAGHSTAMELLTLGKPSVIIPDKKQIEQENNAKRMEELGVSSVINYENLSCERLVDTINMMLNDDSYNQKTQKFAQMAEEINGKAYAADVLREYSQRLQKY